LKPQEDEGRQGEDHTGGNRLSGISRSLHDVIFKDRGAAEGAQNADREHGDGNRGGNRKASTEAYIDRHTPKENAEDRAQKEGAGGEFLGFGARGYVGFKLRIRGLGLSDGSQSSSSRTEAGTVLFQRPMILRGNEKKQ